MPAISTPLPIYLPLLSSIVHRPSSGEAPSSIVRTQTALLGWYGSDNTGDEAVLEAIVNALKKRRVTDIHAFSTNPAKTTARMGVNSSPRNPFHPATLRALRQSNTLILGGGGLIQDRTSVYNLPLYALYVLLARLFGLQIIGWGLGVEPLDTLLGKLLARFICASSTHFSVRDAGSKRLLTKAGIPARQITVAADPAFLIQPTLRTPHSALRTPHSALRTPKVVFCLRDLPDNRPGLNLHYLLPISLRRRLRLGAGGENKRTADFVDAVARGVRVCVEEFGAHVEFLPLWPGRDDKMITAVIEAAVRLGVPPEAMRFNIQTFKRSNVQTFANAVCEADLLVSMRLHALIFAAGGGVPMLALAYARKMRGQMRLLGAERWVVEVETRNPPPEEIEMKLRLLWEMREEQGRLVKEAAQRARERAERDADVMAGLLVRSI